MVNPAINIVMCGIGGQGINGATRKLQEHCFQQGWHCVSAVYKGGAQRLGSVKAEIRLFAPGTLAAHMKSSQIIPGTVTALLVLEQWEGLRNSSMCNENTHFIIDEFAEFPPGNRSNKNLLVSPTQQWSKFNNLLCIADFKKQAVTRYGSEKYTAILMLNVLFQQLQLPLNQIEK